MELRQLEAFVAVATELHFGRAAERLRISQPTVSDLVRRLEREIGTPLLTRTTRRVALTAAGAEMLGRSKVILDEVASATAAARRIAHGDVGTVRLAITPPVAPILAPHLQAALSEQSPEVDLTVTRMWLPDLARAVTDGGTDVAITCALVPEPAGVVSEVFCSEPLFIGLRSTHPLANQDTVALADLARDRLGIPSDALFPAWTLAQRQALDAASLSPPTGILGATDLTASAWTQQSEIAWVFLSASLGTPPATAVRPTSPALRVPYTLQWTPERAQTAAIARFVRLALTLDPPPGWRTEAGHLRHPG